MNDLPLISVVIPVYNVADYIEEAIESILNQTYPNFEVIVVDDASDDGTYGLVKKFEHLDGRIKAYQNDTNCKIAYTLNKAIALSRGNYILRMDGDDISTPDRMEVLYRYLKSHPEIDLVGSAVIGINESGIEVTRRMVHQDERLLTEILFFETPVLHIWLCKKKIYDTIQYRMPLVEDFDFLLRLNTLGYRVSNVPEYLYKARIRKDNSSTIHGLVQKKAHNYALRLYKQRAKGLNDGYSHGHYAKATKVHPIASSLYDLSYAFIKRSMGLRNKKNPLFILFWAGAFISPHMIQYYWRRMLVTMIVRKHRRRTLPRS